MLYPLSYERIIFAACPPPGSNRQPPPFQGDARPLELDGQMVLTLLDSQIQCLRKAYSRILSVREALIRRDGGIRTPDLLLPKQAPYQAEPHPEVSREHDPGTCTMLSTV